MVHWQYNITFYSSGNVFRLRKLKVLKKLCISDNTVYGMAQVVVAVHARRLFI